MLESIRAFWSAYGASVLTVAVHVLLCIGVLAMCKIVSMLARRLICAAARHRLEPTLVPILCTVAAICVYTVGGVMILDLFGVNPNGLVAMIGAAGLAVGLALKDTLSNIAAGIMLLALRPFRAGDAVSCGVNTGTVEAVNLFTVTLRTADGLFISMPNSIVWTGPVTNFTRNGRRRLTVTVGISYGDSIDKGLETLRAIAASEPRFLAEPAPDATVAALADSSVNLQLRGWTANDDYWQTLFDLNRRVKLEIEGAGLSIPFPQRDVHWVAPPFAAK